MKIRYFAETDTLYVVFSDRDIVETRDLNANTLVDRDAEGNVVALTLEHARDHVDLSGSKTQEQNCPLHQKYPHHQSYDRNSPRSCPLPHAATGATMAPFLSVID